MSDPRPIGVFDSGIGGLTVVKELIQRLPDEAVLYFGDTARVPYGSKSPATVARYADDAADFLIERGVKLIVVACNTATAHARERLAERLPIAVLGVIEPGARAAVGSTQRGRIGVIGTTGTIRSGAYDLAIRRRLENSRVYAQACPLFVPLVEEGMAGHAATRLVAEQYLRPLREMDVDVVILGCTHYPLLRPLIQDVMGDDVVLIDSGAEAARDVADTLDRLGLAREPAEAPTHRFAASDAPLRFRGVSRLFVGELVGAVEQVDTERPRRAAPSGAEATVADIGQEVR